MSKVITKVVNKNFEEQANKIMDEQPSHARRPSDYKAALSRKFRVKEDVAEIMYKTYEKNLRKPKKT